MKYCSFMKAQAIMGLPSLVKWLVALRQDVDMVYFELIFDEDAMIPRCKIF